MSRLKEIKARISSVSSTMQITNAMKSVAASKLRKEEEKVQAIRPYVSKIRDIINHIVANSSQEDLMTPFYSEQKESKSILLVFLTSDRGLCSAFNMNVIKRVKKVAESYIKKGIRVTLLPMGKKGNKSSVVKIFDLLEDTDMNLMNDITFEDASSRVQWFLDIYLKGVYDRIEFISNTFVNASLQIVEHQQFLPISLPEKLDCQEELDTYVYEPSKGGLLNTLIPEYLSAKFYEIIVDSLASEHGARMTAMHKATENAKDLKADLSIVYNKARQAAVTTEIIEISAGSEALSA